MLRTVAAQEKLHGADALETGAALSNLAQVLQHTSRCPQAEPLMRRVIGLFEKHFGANHPNVAIALNDTSSIRSFRACLLVAMPVVTWVHDRTQHYTIAGGTE